MHGGSSLRRTGRSITPRSPPSPLRPLPHHCSRALLSLSFTTPMLKRTASPTSSAQPRTSGPGVAHLDRSTGPEPFSTLSSPNLYITSDESPNFTSNPLVSEATWPAFIESYAAGRWRADVTPPIPAAIAHLHPPSPPRDSRSSVIHPELHASSTTPLPHFGGDYSEADEPVPPPYLACGSVILGETPAGGLLQVYLPS